MFSKILCKKFLLISCCVTGMLVASENIIPIKNTNLGLIDLRNCIKIVDNQPRRHTTTTTIYKSFPFGIIKSAKKDKHRKNGIKVKLTKGTKWITYPPKQSDERFLARCTQYTS